MLLAPPFLLFGLYYATESLSCLELPRKIAIAIFDLSIAMWAVVLSPGIRFINTNLDSSLSSNFDLSLRMNDFKEACGPFRGSAGFEGVLIEKCHLSEFRQYVPVYNDIFRSAVSTIDTGDNYFMQFNKDWMWTLMQYVLFCNMFNEA